MILLDIQVLTLPHPIWYTTQNEVELPAMLESVEQDDTGYWSATLTSSDDLDGNGYGWSQGVRSWGFLSQLELRNEHLPFDDEYARRVAALPQE